MYHRSAWYVCIYIIALGHGELIGAREYVVIRSIYLFNIFLLKYHVIYLFILKNQLCLRTPLSDQLINLHDKLNAQLNTYVCAVELPRRTESGINCDHINPIRMHVDKLYDGVLTAATAENPVDLPAMLHIWQAAAAPADGPSASGSTSLAVSLLTCLGMAMIGSLLVA